jgi:hypothetical protein
MLRVAATVLALVLQAAAAPPFHIVEGGKSPDGRLAVAVMVNKSVTDAEINGDDTGVYLFDAKTNKRIGPLEEVGADGGSWGHTMENVGAAWSKDASILAITCRLGRRMHGVQFYEIRGKRAIPLKLPDPITHPKGKVFQHVEVSANPSSSVGTLGKDRFSQVLSGFLPKDGKHPAALKQLGFTEWPEAVEITYGRAGKDAWKITDITEVKDP